MRLLPCGPRAVLVELGSLEDVMAAAAALRAAALPDVCEVVPAARTVLVEHTGGSTAGIERALLEAPPWTPPEVDPVTIDVAYDGEDLDHVARASGMSAAEVIALHSAPTYVAAFCGFLPGFAYLVGLDARLVLPRRATPRTRVPEGSVAIAAEFTGVYPSASPGGWHLLGRTAVVMWDEERDPPALVQPGARVRFRPR